MKEFDYINASADELWDYCMLEYNNSNFIVKKLINNFFNKINEIVKTFGSDFNILEVGCGAGESTQRIHAILKEDQRIQASDIDERYIDKMKELNVPYKVSVESVYDLKRSDNEFDCVIMLEVLEHLENIDLALKELFRVSSKFVLISVPNEPIWSLLNLMRFKYIKNLGNTPGHINHWSPSKLRKLLSNYGRVINITTSLPWIISLTEIENFT